MTMLTNPKVFPSVDILDDVTCVCFAYRLYENEPMTAFFATSSHAAVAAATRLVETDQRVFSVEVWQFENEWELVYEWDREAVDVASDPVGAIPR